MKYFLALLLLVAVTSTVVEEQLFDIENFEDIELEKFNVKGIFKGIGNFFKGPVAEAFRKLKKAVQKGVKWLKDNGFWEPLVKKVKELGKKYAPALCQKFLKKETCDSILDFIEKHVLKNMN